MVRSGPDEATSVSFIFVLRMYICCLHFVCTECVRKNAGRLAGAFGTAFLEKDVVTGEEVSIKYLPRGPKARLHVSPATGSHTAGVEKGSTFRNDGKLCMFYSNVAFIFVPICLPSLHNTLCGGYDAAPILYSPGRGGQQR